MKHEVLQDVTGTIEKQLHHQFNRGVLPLHHGRLLDAAAALKKCHFREILQLQMAACHLDGVPLVL